MLLPPRVRIACSMRHGCHSAVPVRAAVQQNSGKRFRQAVKQSARQQRVQLGPGCLAELCESLVYCRQCGTQSCIPNVNPEAVQVL